MKIPKIAKLCIALLPILALVAFPTFVSAQQAKTGPTVKFQLFEINGLVVGDRLEIDDAFSERHNIPVPAPFSVLVPRENGIQRLAINAPEGPDGPFLKLSFTDQDKQLIENIRLIPMSVPMGTNPTARINGLAQLMANQVYDQATAGYTKRSRDVVKLITLNGLPAVEVIGRYEDPEFGLMYLRIVGIPNPKGTESVFVVANVAHDSLELATPEDFGRTRGGVMLREFKFLSAR